MDEKLTGATQVAKWNEQYDLAHHEGNANLWGDPHVPYAEAAARRFAGAHASVVLDLPCGDGRNLPPLSAGAPILLAADTSPNAMAIAAQVASKAGIRDKTVFLTLNAFSTGLLEDSVDGIYSWDLLGHLTEPASALREFYRILRPGGSIITNVWTMNDCQVTDPNMTSIGDKEFHDHFGFYCRHYDREDLDAMLGTAGLTAALVETSGWTDPPHAHYRTYEHQHESLVVTIRKDYHQ
ncbi:MAG TPA: class I SAM-dependent methyltransferase [Trebonia sp.]|jgi:ubiquinone/menaquinone biosynthesis C-methylase UbiE|nr:class I SAM-dependent methyltransferase [Trebonia sp.]